MPARSPLRSFAWLLIAASLGCSSLALSANDLAAAPEVRLPVAEIEAAIARAKPEPLRYAVDHALGLDLRNGIWDEPSLGMARWRLRLHSPGARTLSAQLERLHLPAGATLWLSTADGDDRHGPLLPDADGGLWTPVVRAASALLELWVPVEQRDAVSLHIAAAQHGYRNPFERTPAKGEFGDSGSCNINVTCSEGDRWRNEIRSTVLLTISNSTLCSGTLVNNLRQDNRALILTANHCGVRATNALATRAYFNVQKSSCGASEDGSIAQNIAGLRFLARDARSDFTLFELATRPPGSFNVHYAGWNADPAAVPQSGVGIHHPSGDDKKISVYSSAVQRADGTQIGGLLGGFTVDAWQVRWSRGTTEGGSSGSGLWNQNRQLVGMLSGGSASCTNLDGADFYGRFEQAWTAGSASNAQLKAHLDPDNSGCLTLAGRNPDSAASGACGATPTEPESGGSGGGGGSPGAALLLALLAAALRRHRRAA